jgi:hypothetical protein
VGGNSTDDGTVPSTLPTGWLEPFNQMHADTGAQYTLSLSGFKADSLSTAVNHANYFLANLNSGTATQFEIGNEPDFYISSCSTFVSQWDTFQSGINGLSGGSGIKFVGPSNGGTGWSCVPAFISSAPGHNLQTVSEHWYSMCGSGSGCTPATITNMLSTATATSGPNNIASHVSDAHAAGYTFRMNEMNSTYNGAVEGVSDSFASALWSIDTAFHFAAVGVDGINWESDSCYTSNNCGGTEAYDLWVFAYPAFSLYAVRPIYYGMWLFQEATQNQAKLIPCNITTSANVVCWATIDAAGVVRIVAENKDQSSSGNVSVTVPGTYGNGTLKYLTAPSASSTTGVTYAGQSISLTDGTITGTLSSTTITPASNVYTFSLTATSAALLTVAP